MSRTGVVMWAHIETSVTTKYITACDKIAKKQLPHTMDGNVAFNPLTAGAAA